MDFLADKGCDPAGLSEEEVQNIEEYRELELLLPEVKSPVLIKFLKDKVLKEKIREAKKCLCSKMLYKIEIDVSYEESVETKIEEYKKQGIFILRHGMVEHYLDKNGGLVIGDGKDDRESELNEFFSYF